MQAETSQQSKECETTSLINKQIYIVDDDKSVCRALKLLMLTYGFTVNTFFSAEDFFSAVPNSSQGCLILDVNLPGLNGWQAQQRLRQAGSNRPVIVISADKNEGLAEKALKVGAVGFLQKPFNDQELVVLIRQSFLKGE